MTLADDGFTFHRAALSRSSREELIAALFSSRAASASDVPPHGIRNLLWDEADLARALTRLGVDDIASDALAHAAFPIQALFFDKTSAANWKVPCHQDVVMPVAAKVDEPGFARWSTKAGVVHVEPPTEVLAGLVALRVHFDDCSSTNGALSVLPASHLRGKLRDEELAAIDLTALVACDASAGDILATKPLTVHRSSSTSDLGHRRVLHVVYATREPGVSVRWRRP